MNHRNDGSPTDLYLVRIWRRKARDGAPSLHGKLLHTVSGATCYFDGLSSLPGAFERLMEQQPGTPGPREAIEPSDGSDGEIEIG